MSRVTYQEAETYISELPKFTKKNTLEHTQKFLSFSAIHRMEKRSSM